MCPSSTTLELDPALAPGDAKPPVPLVDCDVHPMIGDIGVLAKRVSSRAARRFGSQLGAFARDPNRIPHPTSGLRLDAVTPAGGPPGSDAAFAREQWLDPYGVAAAVLIPVQAGMVIQWADEGGADEFLRAMNDHLHEEWCGLDSRYRLTLSVSPHDIDAAVEEVERLGGAEGIVGVNVPYANISLGSRHFFPLYEAAERHGLPIVVHPTGAEGNAGSGPTLAGGIPHTYPERHAMLLMPGQAILASMVFGGVFDRFPNLKLVLTEFGFSWLPSVLWRMDEAWEKGDRELAGIERAPSSYVHDNVRFTTQPIDEPSDHDLLWDLVGTVDAADVLMFSSDYPHWDSDDPRVVLKSRVPAPLQDRIAWRNAEACFGQRLGL